MNFADILGQYSKVLMNIYLTVGGESRILGVISNYMNLSR